MINWRKSLPHIFVGIVVFLSMGIGLGYRHLSMNEVETAEKGRTILESGFPRTIDKSGHPSMWSGGSELEDGNTHRYTPWGQFYAAAAGIGLGRILDIEKDKAVRLPFSFSHATAASLTSYGLTTMAMIPWPVSAGLGIAYFLQTERLLYNRAARYPALLDLLLIFGLLGIFGYRTGKRRWVYFLPFSIFCLPQVQTLGGSLLALSIGVLAFFVIWEKDGLDRKGLYSILKWIVLPGILSLIVLLLLTRPWIPRSWGEILPYDLLRTLRMRKRMLYSIYFLIASAVVFFINRKSRRGVALISLLLVVIFISSLLDRFSYSQYRYYLSLPLLFLFGPMTLGWTDISRKSKWTLIAILILFAFVPEFTTRRFVPYQGLRISFYDWNQERKGTQQPLHEAMAYIRDHAKKGDPVLIDSTPQYANWYLPDQVITLIPDASTKNSLNRDHPIWKREMPLPQWHLWYPDMNSGIPASPHKSDFFATHPDYEKGQYLFTSHKLGKKVTMCIEKVWQNDLYNNESFNLYRDVSFNPGGGPMNRMVLGRPCPPRESCVLFTH